MDILGIFLIITALWLIVLKIIDNRRFGIEDTQHRPVDDEKTWRG